MDDAPLAISPSADASDELAQSLERQRARVQEFAAQHRQRIGRIQGELAEQIARITQELDADRQRVQESCQELDTQQQDFDRRAADLARLQDELEQRQTALHREEQAATQTHEELTQTLALREEELRSLREQIERGQFNVQQAQRELGSQREELAADQRELARQRKRLEERLAEFDQRQEELDDLQLRTKSQRRRIAHEFQEQRDAARRRDAQARLALEEQTAALERRKATVEADLQGHARQAEQLEQRERQLAVRTAELDSQAASIREQAAAVRSQESRDQRELTEKITQLTAERDRQAAESRQSLEALARAEQSRLAAEAERDAALQSREQSDGEEASKANRWDDERRKLIEQIEGLERSLAEARDQTDDTLDREEAEQNQRDVERRHQLALDEIRDQRAQIAHLEQQLTRRAAAPRPPSPAAGDGMDWESQKRRLLAQLEQLDDNDLEQAGEKLSARDVIRRTEALVVERDREIAELREHLQQQSTNLGEVAVGAAAIAEMLDADEIVRQERENLQTLQNEWQDKLRKAEVELSLERAKIARERMAIEEKLIQLERAQAHAPKETSATSKPSATDKKPVRGRWLSRLGLRDDDEGA